MASPWGDPGSSASFQAAVIQSECFGSGTDVDLEFLYRAMNDATFTPS
jgi:hypothetical protein